MLLRWLILIPLALFLAISASSVFLFVASVADPVMADLMGNTVFVGFWSLLDAIFESDDPGFLMAQTLGDVSRVLFTFLVLPLLLVALVSEVTRARSLLWMAGATGVLTAAVPWILRGSPRMTSPTELHISVVLGLTGAVAGLVYWAVAGRPPAPPPAPLPPAPPRA
ncbi:hypothetical protein [Microvirga pudoricolor]|uniref:hypothetical protein n=1 Tax=Microvirga pudoricolor TaxID=2778729 RepID=UPI00194DE04E|nr:hypothetical protein [Microvirga pudoricolor]MBM6593796.1 hypothetical protein [Microvirga pudoricolor]